MLIDITKGDCIMCSKCELITTHRRTYPCFINIWFDATLEHEWPLYMRLCNTFTNIWVCPVYFSMPWPCSCTGCVHVTNASLSMALYWLCLSYILHWPQSISHWPVQSGWPVAFNSRSRVGLHIGIQITHLSCSRSKRMEIWVYNSCSFNTIIIL